MGEENKVNKKIKKRKIKYVLYLHHGEPVWVRADQKGLHWDACLCYSCKKFKPNDKDNCPIAQKVYDLNVANDITTPVWECPVFADIELKH